MRDKNNYSNRDGSKPKIRKRAIRRNNIKKRSILGTNKQPKVTVIWTYNVPPSPPVKLCEVGKERVYYQVSSVGIPGNRGNPKSTTVNLNKYLNVAPGTPIDMDTLKSLTKLIHKDMGMMGVSKFDRKWRPWGTKILSKLERQLISEGKMVYLSDNELELRLQQLDDNRWKDFIIEVVKISRERSVAYNKAVAYLDDVDYPNKQVYLKYLNKIGLTELQIMLKDTNRDG